MSTAQTLHILGLSHRTATVALREKAALAAADIPKALASIRTIFEPAPDVVILSTCNRTELYLMSAFQLNRSNIEEAFQAIRPKIFHEIAPALYYYEGPAALAHLFRVASGLDSMVLGEPQILGQVKDAFRLAQELGFVGTMLNRLFDTMIVASRRVRTETALNEGAVSVAFAAVELAQKIFKNLGDHCALMIGAGETGELTARHLVEKGIDKLYIANRTLSKAEAVARELGGQAIPFGDVPGVLPRVNVVIGSTGAPDFVLTKSHVKNALSQRSAAPLFFIDIAVPRDFDPGINDLSNVFLHDIDSLQNIVTKNLSKRQKEIPQAGRILAEEIDHFLDWQNSLRLKPTIIALRQHFEEIRKQEVEKNRNRFSEKEFARVDALTRGLINKLLHEPMVQLKQLSGSDSESIQKLDVIRQFFDLKDYKHDQNDTTGHPG